MYTISTLYVLNTTNIDKKIKFREKNVHLWFNLDREKNSAFNFCYQLFGKLLLELDYQ